MRQVIWSSEKASSENKVQLYYSLSETKKRDLAGADVTTDLHYISVIKSLQLKITVPFGQRIEVLRRIQWHYKQ